MLPLTLDHRERFLDFAPAAVRRTFTLLEFAHLVSTLDVSSLDETLTPGERLRVLVPRAGLARAKSTPAGGYDVPDPFGRGPEDFALAWSLIQDAADAIVRVARGR